VTSGSSLTATSIGVSGPSYQSSGSTVKTTVDPTPVTNAAQEGDPLAHMNPSIPSLPTISQRKYECCTKHILKPGYYSKGIELNSATATLEPGLYVINMTGVGEDALKLKSGSTLTGEGVSFYFTGSSDKRPLSIESGSKVQLSAMTTGDMAGMLFFRRGSDSSPLLAEIASNSETYFEGVIYFPNDKLRFHSGVTSNTGADWTAIIAKELEVSSGTKLNVNANPSSVPNPLMATNTRLVE
jgi:hypothetical protein